MSWTVPVALYGWIPLVAILFALVPAPRAVLIAYFAGWMFLPMAGLELFGFFDYSKSTAVPLVVFLAVAAFDGQRLLRFRAAAVDLPMAVFCVTPLATSLSNDLGWYDGLSSTTYQTIAWGLPYLTGRLYFSSLDGARRVAIALLIGGLVYAPLCLWEVRMSPQLHAWVYGFHQHDWVQTLRGGGFRPMVFMQHGLMVGMWMSAASTVGVALWMSGARRRLWGVPLGLLVAGLLVTTVLCKSFGSLALLGAGLLALASMRWLRTSLPMALLVVAPATYVAVRATGSWAGQQAVDVVGRVAPDRATSLEFRIASEEKLRVRAAQKPLLGWGGWGRSFVRRFDDPDRPMPVTIDSLWIIVFGKNGWAGLASVLLIFAMPALVAWRVCPPRLWDRALFVWPWALALVVTLYALDSMVNAMLNPVYVLGAGAVCGLAPALARARERARVAPLSPHLAGARLR